jgi:hypothetical protein
MYIYYLIGGFCESLWIWWLAVQLRPGNFWIYFGSSWLVGAICHLVPWYFGDASEMGIQSNC